VALAVALPALCTSLILVTSSTISARRVFAQRACGEPGNLRAHPAGREKNLCRGTDAGRGRHNSCKLRSTSKLKSQLTATSSAFVRSWKSRFWRCSTRIRVTVAFSGMRSDTQQKRWQSPAPARTAGRACVVAHEPAPATRKHAIRLSIWCRRLPVFRARRWQPWGWVDAGNMTRNWLVCPWRRCRYPTGADRIPCSAADCPSASSAPTAASSTPMSMPRICPGRSTPTATTHEYHLGGTTLPWQRQTLRSETARHRLCVLTPLAPLQTALRQSVLTSRASDCW